MDLSAESLRDALHRVDVAGWDSAAGLDLLDHIRRAVVVPVVRRSGLRGPAADQAEATGWEAAWDALRRPTARTAQNPGGMVWVAVRRAVASEVDFARMPDAEPVVAVAQRAVADAGDTAEPRTTTGRAARTVEEGRPSPPRSLARPDRPRRCLSLDDLMDGGWQPAETGLCVVEGPGPLWLRSSTPWLPSAGIEQVLRTRSRSWPITQDTTGPAHPSRGGVGCRSASGSRSGRRGALRFCSSGVMAGRASSSSSSAGAQVVRDPAVRGAVQSTTLMVRRPERVAGQLGRQPGGGRMSGPSRVSGAGSPMRSAVDLEPPKSLPTIRESIYGEIDSYAACRPICPVCRCARRGRCHACWCAVRRTPAQPGPSCHHGPRRPTLIPGEQP